MPSFFLPGLPQTGDRNAAPVDISARRFSVDGAGGYLLEDQAELIRLDQRLLAPQLLYRVDLQTYEAEQGLSYQDRMLLVEAERARGDLGADRSELEALRYRLVAQRGNGEARRARVEGDVSSLDDVTYSTCEPEQLAWLFRAERIDLDTAEGVGYARNARVELGGVPVFYFPYVSFPIDERRRSGFLYPGVSSGNSNGLDIRLPYYLNLAPNYDATLNLRSLGRRGLMFGGEFRYLGRSFDGILEADWLPNDRVSDRDRGAFRYRHGGRLSDTWLLRADLNHVSDDRYFEDFGDSLTSISTTLLESLVGVYGRGDTWQASAVLRDFQLVDPLIPNSAAPFQQLPQLRYSIARPLAGGLQAGGRAEAVAFGHSDRDAGQRYDFYPWLRWPVERAWGFLRPELGLRHTRYQLERGFLDALPERSPERSLPIVSVDAGLLFERPAKLFGQALNQTLEPRLYYLRVPFEDQSNLPLFDTQELSFSFAQLFRPNRFTGADRQADANQLTLALGSRFFDTGDGRERFAVSAGQVRYFDAPRVGLDGMQPDGERRASPFVGEVAMNFNRRFSAGIGSQWDPDERRTDLSAIRAQYRGDEGAVANIGYRFRRTSGTPVEQVDASWLAPIGPNWRLLGRWNYSIADRRTIEAFAGLQWESCCLAVRVLGRHYVRNREGEKNNALFLEVELKGLGRFGRDSEELLQRAILGYSR
ncbi:MAG: LPS assembly protein LptD [Aquimonas sp.]|nr:LPS assembly protein LptD [Aquimonas sp.]